MAYGHGDGGGGPDPRDDRKHRGAERTSRRAARALRHGARVYGSYRPTRSPTTCRSGTASSTSNIIAGRIPARRATSATTARASSCSTTPSFWRRWRRVAADCAYPHDDVNKAWELICLNQFHDILPGSSIIRFTRTATKITRRSANWAKACASARSRRWRRRCPADTAVIAVNPTSFGGRRIGLSGRRDQRRTCRRERQLDHAGGRGRHAGRTERSRALLGRGAPRGATAQRRKATCRSAKQTA